MKKIVVAGGGVLGSQIAFQAAYCGFDVTIWLRSEESITRTRPKINALQQAYIGTIEGMEKNPARWAMGIADVQGFDKNACIEKVKAAYAGLKLETDMKKAVADADIVIESVAENVDVKVAFYKNLAPLLPEKTILLTNSSTLLPSQFAEYTGRPERYLALHFANQIWFNNMAEVMGHAGTDAASFDATMEFAKQIRMEPIPVRKEKSGYLLNSLLVPFLFSALDLMATEVAEPADIDKAWRMGFGSPLGPFQIMDIVGLTTVYNIVSMYVDIPENIAPFHYKAICSMVKGYIEQGKLGVAAGEGFYKY